LPTSSTYVGGFSESGQEQMMVVNKFTFPLSVINNIPSATLIDLSNSFFDDAEQSSGHA